MNTIDCPGCGARNQTSTRRCRTCGQVINRGIPELERGLAALHPDTGFGTSFSASWARRGLEGSVVVDEPESDQLAEERPPPAADRRWTSSPVEATIPPWEPVRDGIDDESVALASTIVLDVPLRNGATPPPVEYEVEPFDPDGLDWDRGPA
jgi:hypothetical protein